MCLGHAGVGGWCGWRFGCGWVWWKLKPLGLRQNGSQHPRDKPFCLVSWCFWVNDKGPPLVVWELRNIGSQPDPPWRNQTSHAASSCLPLLGMWKKQWGKWEVFCSLLREQLPCSIPLHPHRPTLLSEAGYHDAVNFGRSKACKYFLKQELFCFVFLA